MFHMGMKNWIDTQVSYVEIVKGWCRGNGDPKFIKERLNSLYFGKCRCNRPILSFGGGMSNSMLFRTAPLDGVDA